MTTRISDENTAHFIHSNSPLVSPSAVVPPSTSPLGDDEGLVAGDAVAPPVLGELVGEGLTRGVAEGLEVAEGEDAGDASGVGLWARISVVFAKLRKTTDKTTFINRFCII